MNYGKILRRGLYTIPLFLTVGLAGLACYNNDNELSIDTYSIHNERPLPNITSSPTPEPTSTPAPYSGDMSIVIQIVPIYERNGQFQCDEQIIPGEAKFSEFIVIDLLRAYLRFKKMFCSNNSTNVLLLLI